MSGPTEHTAYLSVGGNIGNPRVTLVASLRLLDGSSMTRVTAVSPLYRTPPWGELRQPHFLNAAVELKTELAPMALLRLCQEIEQKLKRIRTERFGPRSIDLDILAYDAIAVSQPMLEIPHPGMFDRAFVMVPLADIAPTLVLKGHAIADWAEKLGSDGFTRETDDGGWWV